MYAHRTRLPVVVLNRGSYCNRGSRGQVFAEPKFGLCYLCGRFLARRTKATEVRARLILPLTGFPLTRRVSRFTVSTYPHVRAARKA